MKEPIDRCTATAVKSPKDELLAATDRRIAKLRLRLQSETAIDAVVAEDLAACLEIRERFVRNSWPELAQPAQPEGRVLH